MSGFSDELLMAFADGGLPEAEAARVAAAAAADPALASRIERFRETGRLLGDVFRDTLDEPVPARLVATARGIAVIQGSAAPPAAVAAAPAPLRTARPWRAMAAAASVALAVGAVAGFGAGRGADGPGRLGSTLEAVLEGTPAGGTGNFRVLATHDTEGAGPCRIFAAQTEGLRGLACRTPQGWRLRLAVGGGRDGFTPASGDDALLAEMLDRLQAGPALGAQAEAALLARRWRENPTR